MALKIGGVGVGGCLFGGSGDSNIVQGNGEGKGKEEESLIVIIALEDMKGRKRRKQDIWASEYN